MPPKAAVAQGSVVDGKFMADQEQAMTQFGEFLATKRRPLSVAEYSALIPQYTGGPHWTAQEEADLQAQGKYASILHRGQEIWDKNGGARLLWRLFPMVYRCLPTDLFSCAYRVDVDTSQNVQVQEGPHVGQVNIVWSRRFCVALINFTMHGFWAYKREWDFPIMAQLMQLAVICRTNDCRAWRLVNYTEDIFFTELSNETQVQTAGVRTIKDIMDVVDARMNARNVRPSQFRLLCREVIRRTFDSSVGPILNGTPGTYKVTLEDITALAEALSHFGPSPERAGMIHGWSAETWKAIMERSWPHDNKQEPQPNRANGDLLARAMMFGFVGRERDEKIAQRAAQAGAAAQPFGQAQGHNAAQALALSAALSAVQAPAPANPAPAPAPAAAAPFAAPVAGPAPAPTQGLALFDPFNDDEDDDDLVEPRLSSTAKGKGKATAVSEAEDTMMAEDDHSGGVFDDYAVEDFGSGDVEPAEAGRAGTDQEFAEKFMARINARLEFNRKHPERLAPALINSGWWDDEDGDAPPSALDEE